ncbi:hypothetical protein VPNG_10274 [Cytospora leucostoma]|uniref:Uncharacterized protein n=1 Tax=Cytospora leucostoma TaxID=1230097 RepID=A0A423VBP5_9PEZI|nr:hypothetical protein VPNG_10274 [Cytospora leucostoma]
MRHRHMIWAEARAQMCIHPASATTATPTPTGTNPAPAPAETQMGASPDCKAWHVVVSGDECWAFANT